ncbi:MAG: TetR/AcrR family transcriptional regulator [Spirochaetaceae bacterium]
MTNRKTRAMRTKVLLFESALALFKEKGFDAVTIDDIAQRAGTAKGTFYTYFSTKSEIIIEEFQAIDEHYRRYARNLRRYDTARAQLIAFTRTQLRYVRDRIGLEMLKLLYSNQIAHPKTEKVLVDTKRYLHTLVRDIVEFGRRRGEFRTDLSSDRLAQLFNRSMRSVFLDWAISDSAFDLVREGVAYCEEVMLPALVAQSAPQGHTDTAQS